MKKKKLIRILAVTLCLLICIAGLPAAALAEGDSGTPSTGSEIPSSGSETPGTGSETPGSGSETPSSGSESPSTGSEAPSTGSEAPAAGTGDTSGSGSAAGTGSGSSAGDSSGTGSSTGDSTGTGSSTGDSTDTGTTDGSDVTNSDITVIPSNANALVLMDVGAQSPKGAPGEVVTVVLPIAVNKEYLPSEKYVLRNINVIPAIPTDSSVANWPFDIIDAGSTRHLSDMSYNSTADVYFDFRISQFAKKGVYPVNFNVNATVWRYDDVNGTTINEDVTFKLCVYVTVTDNGSMSGVTTSFGCLQISGSNISGTKTVSTASPGQRIRLSIPVINVGGSLTNITVSPVVSSSLDEFPFVVGATNYARTFDSWASGEVKVLDYDLTVSPYATTGNKSIRFKGTYFENGAAAEGTFSTQLTIVNGYEPSAMSVMVESYKLYVGGTEVSGLMAGEEADLVLTLVNNSSDSSARKVLVNLVFTNSPGLTICPGSTDSTYVDSIGAGSKTTARLKVKAKADSDAGSQMLGIGVTYESADGVTGKANQNIMIPVSQKMDLQIGTPAVYGKQVKGKESTVSLSLTNMGRGKILSIRVLASDGMSQTAPCYVGDLLPGGSTSADVLVTFTKIGNYNAVLIVQYEDGNGQLYTQTVPVSLNVAETGTSSNTSSQTPEGNGTANDQGGSARTTLFGSIWPYIVIAILAAAVIVLLVLRGKGPKGGGKPQP